MDQLTQILTGFLTFENLIFIIGIVITFLATNVFIGNVVLKELSKLPDMIHDAVQETSPGGKTITKKEAEEIANQVLKVLWCVIRKKFGWFKFLMPKK